MELCEVMICRSGWGRSMVEMLPTAVLLALAVSVVAKDNSTCDGPCGLRFRQNLQGALRVVGGQSAQHGAWPWMVSLQIFMIHNSRRYHACGGILLNSHWVLTAAHCFDNQKKIHDWRLIFGAQEIEYGNSKPVKAPLQERYVEKIVIHEKYSAVTEGNDIALLKITPPIPCGRFIGPACLPHFKAGPPKVPQTCYVAGWGYIKENDLLPVQHYLAHLVPDEYQGSSSMSSTTDQLTGPKEARVNLIELDLCNSTQWYNGRVMSTNVCAGYPEGKIDTCQGDSGGPLMCRDNANSPFVVVGITSWGVGCARAKRPGIYTTTWDYLDWIASKIGRNALHMIQPATPPPPTTRPQQPQVRPLSSRPPSSRPPWYFQRPNCPPHPPHPPLPHPFLPLQTQSQTPAAQAQSLPPFLPSPPPSPPPSSHTNLPQGLSFAKRLQQLIEALKGRAYSISKSSYYEITELPETIPS